MNDQIISCSILLILMTGLIGCKAKDASTASSQEPAPEEETTVEETAVDVEAEPKEEPLREVPEPAYVKIPAGTFEMGSPESEPDRSDDETQHEVTITRPFFMKRTEVTQAEWESLMGHNPSRESAYGAASGKTDCPDSCPVERVSWNDAIAYVNKLSEKEGLETCYETEDCGGNPSGGCEVGVDFCDGDYACSKIEFKGLDCKGYRLPTEAEWEYAARAGATGATYGPLDDIAWYARNTGEMGGIQLRKGTRPVGQKKPNDFGLYDMLGNVYEWTSDYYFAGYPDEPVVDPLGFADGFGRLLRGCSVKDTERKCRLAFRFTARSNSEIPADKRINIAGFRPVRTATHPSATD